MKKIYYRTWVQLFAMVALLSAWRWRGMKYFCFPVLNCHACPTSVFACPIGVLIHYAGYRVFPLIAAGTVLLFGILLGRMLCGWACPFGFLQDLLHRLPGRKFTLPRWTRGVKYAVLVATVFAVPFLFGENSNFVFCRFCPAAALEVTVPSVIQASAISAASAFKIALAAGVMLFAVFVSRGFCSVFCPIGAMLAPLNYICGVRIKSPTERCVSCQRCDKKCPTGVEPSRRFDKGRPANDSLDCILCTDCRSACPRKS